MKNADEASTSESCEMNASCFKEATAVEPNEESVTTCLRDSHLHESNGNHSNCLTSVECIKRYYFCINYNLQYTNLCVTTANSNIV